ncbi:hypothetical protein Hanom_Chr09g00776081 [Helianthus anomalus]
MPRFPQSGQTIQLFPLVNISMHAPGMSCTRHNPSPSIRRSLTFTEEELAESNEESDEESDED